MPRTYSWIPPSSHSFLKQYKYSGVDKSFLSRYVLSYYWNWLIEWFPLWMAPNLITSIGFFFIIFNACLALYYSPSLLNPVPSYCCYLFALGIFIYQSLDAIDGKQARRTGQSSPLGHLFDHGCDALNTMLTAICLIPVLGIGGSPLLLISIFSALGNFYLTTWEEYNTGVLYLGYFSGPVEGVLILITLFNITGYFGSEIFQATTPFLSMTYAESFVIFGIVVIALNCTNSIWNVYKHGKPNATLGLLPFFNFCYLIYSWCNLSPHVLKYGSAPLCLFITFSFGRMVGKIILAHILKLSFPKFDVSWVPLILAIIHANSEAWFSIPRFLTPSQELWYLWGCAFFAFWMYISFARQVVKEICSILDIWCFKIKRPLLKKQS